MSKTSRICAFALPLPVYHGFDYAVDEVSNYQPGIRAELPFGRGNKIGIRLPGNPSEEGERELKAAIVPLDEQPVLSSHLLELGQWMAEYYCQPLGEVLFFCLPGYLRKSQTQTETRLRCWKLDSIDPQLEQSLQTRAPRQHQLLQALRDKPQGMTAAELRSIHANWRQPLSALEQQGLVSSHWQEALPATRLPLQQACTLTADQQQVYDRIRAESQQFLVHLIEGVTGSGKTEIYLDLMQEVIARGQQIIYLVPEIGLTPQLLGRLQQRLGPVVVTSHSAQTEWQRYQAWDQFRRAAARVMLGTRSALFAQSDDIGLIIIDEEHDSSYRQQDGVRYHARDVAIKRAQMLDIPIILGSATPSLETLYNLARPHYRLHKLEQRVNRSPPPSIQLIDCSQQPLTGGCSPQLLQAIRQHLAAEGQVLLFLNRRGFAPVVMCHDCGWQASCFQCDARMTLHQAQNQLICHHCGHRLPMPVKCPDCGQSALQHYGIGTEQLQDFLQQQFTGVEVIRIDRDTVSSAQQVEHKMQALQQARPCILVGTQMLAKGHDYPHITLVGILDADQALYSSFYRAGERLAQTVLQVAGRAGRADKKGQALLQTAFPSHPLMQGLRDQTYAELVQPMLDERKLIGFPPYVRVVSFQVDALSLDLALDKLQQVRQLLMPLLSEDEIKLVGPIPALMARRVGRYRAQLTLMADNFAQLRQVLQQALPQIQALRNTRKSQLTIEVDPVDL